MPRRCDATDCDKQPLYGLPNAKKATFCKKHKSSDMIDIVHKRCDVINL